MSLDKKFNNAVGKAKGFLKPPTNYNHPDYEYLDMYSLFKQGTVGDNNTPKPPSFDFRAKAKWDAWEDKKGMSQNAAKEAYIQLIEKLSPKYTL